MGDDATPLLFFICWKFENQSIGQTVARSVSASPRSKKMRHLYKLVLLILVMMAMLHNTLGKKKVPSSKNVSKKPTSHDPSQGTKTQPNYPRQPSSPDAGGNAGNPYQQKPGRGGYHPGDGVYPVRTGGIAGGFSSFGGQYPNWNPNNKILSPRYGAAYGAGGFGTGGSPFSRSVQSMGYAPSTQSKSFGKQAMLAAGAGGLAGMAVGNGVRRSPRPDVQFNNPQEEYHYNQYMHQRHETGRDKKNDYGHNYNIKLPPQAQSYDQFMTACMKRTDLLKEQKTFDPADQSHIQGDEPVIAPDNVHTEKDKSFTSSPTAAPLIPAAENHDTVDILNIGYPALIEQMKARKCVELYVVYRERFLEKIPQSRSNGHSVSSLLLTIAAAFMLLSST